MAIKIIDMKGQVRDWAWVQATYGPVAIEEPGVSGPYYRVVMIQEVERQGFCLALRDASGLPVAGTRVIYSWPDADQQPGCGWDGYGAVEVTNAIGTAEHSSGRGEAYYPPNKGAISWWVFGEPECSQKISGLGWLVGTQYRHLDVTMQMSGDGGDDDGGGCNLGPVNDKLDQILAILKAGLHA